MLCVSEFGNIQQSKRQKQSECNAWEILLLISTLVRFFCSAIFQFVSRLMSELAIYIDYRHNSQSVFRIFCWKCSNPCDSWEIKPKSMARTGSTCSRSSCCFSRFYRRLFMFFFVLVWSHRERSFSYVFFIHLSTLFFFSLVLFCVDSSCKTYFKWLYTNEANQKKKNSISYS